MHSFHITISSDVDNETAAAFGDSLSDIAAASVAMRIDRDESNPWSILWYFDDAPDEQNLKGRIILQAQLSGLVLPDLSTLKLEPVANENWLEKVYKELEPFSVGPFYIHGSHFEGEVPDTQIGLMIDAATAFGSGDHGSTKGCLEAMLDLKAKGICPWNILDMGTGSGILAIAAWKLWHTPITATDIDEESVRVAERYRAFNKVPDGKSGLICAQGDGFEIALVQERKPYELVIANILAGPLIDMAPSLFAVTDRPGYAILSGMLLDQAEGVQAAYEKAGFTFKKIYTVGKWATMVLQK